MRAPHIPIRTRFAATAKPSGRLANGHAGAVALPKPVSLITAELPAAQLVPEGLRGKLPRRREPTFLPRNSSRLLALGGEIRAAKTTLAGADLSSHSRARILPTTAGACLARRRAGGLILQKRFGGLKVL